MKKCLILILFATIFSCSQKATPEEVEKALKKSMQEHLENSSEAKVSNAKYEVQEVTYFPGKEYFECEFKVHMKTDTKDTVGVMKAQVTRDFSKVIRRL